MNGIYIPETNNITNKRNGSEKTYLESRAFNYLKDEWIVRKLDLDAEGRKCSGYSDIVLGTDYTGVYRIGNICVLNLYLPLINITQGVFVNLYQLPWKPYYDVYDCHNTVPFTGVDYGIIRIKISKDTGIISLAAYNPTGSTSDRLMEITSNLIFPLALPVE